MSLEAHFLLAPSCSFCQRQINKEDEEKQVLWILSLFYRPRLPRFIYQRVGCIGNSGSS
jgi:hypothetical protein